MPILPAPYDDPADMPVRQPKSNFLDINQFRPSLQTLLKQSQQMRTPSNQTYVAGVGRQVQQLHEQTARRRQEFLSNLQGQLSQTRFNVPGSPVAAVSGGNDFQRFVSAIRGKESGGNYRAVNRSSGALGAYQIMPGNVRAWSQKFLGRTISPQEFLNNPQLQDYIAQRQLKEYYDRYGPAGAATAWYAGPGAVGTSRMYSTRNQGGYPSISAYWRDILSRMGR